MITVRDSSTAERLPHKQEVVRAALTPATKTYVSSAVEFASDKGEVGGSTPSRKTDRSILQGITMGVSLTVNEGYAGSSPAFAATLLRCASGMRAGCLPVETGSSPVRSANHPFPSSSTDRARGYGPRNEGSIPFSGAA